MVLMGRSQAGHVRVAMVCYYIINIFIYSFRPMEERGGSVVECLTRDRGVAASSLTGGTVLYPCARHFILCLVLVQRRKTCPDITEKLLTGT